MMFSERWLKAFEARDKEALAGMIDDDFEFVRHQSGKSLRKDDMVDIWSREGPRPVRRDFRIIYENDEVAVSHQFMDFPSGDQESLIMVMVLKDGKLTRMETGASPIS